jgi:hypothetical protein
MRCVSQFTASAYWGPPFVGEADHARFACLAAMEMIERITQIRVAVVAVTP